MAVPLYAYAFLDDLVLLYPVYALLFSQTGLSVGQISMLFACWSLSSLILEVPSGALADTVSRRMLLWIGPLLAAAGFTLWVCMPSYWAFACGFVLWGAKGALGSGALEALIYEELDRVGAADRYGQIMGRARTASTIGTVLAMGTAAPVLAAGGYLAVGAATVTSCLLTAAVATTLPEHRGDSPGRADESGEDSEDLGWVAALRAGLAEARHHRTVRSAVLLVVTVSAVWGSLDEYTPLLISSIGVSDATVPLYLLVIWAAVAGGGLATGWAERLGTARFAVLLVFAAAVLAAGALSGRPAGIVLVAVAFAAFQAADVVAGARLQQRVTGPARATVTSVAGMATDLATVAVYGLYALLADRAGHSGAFALLAVPYVAVATWLLVAGRRRHARSAR